MANGSCCIEFSGSGIDGFSSLLAFHGNVTLSANTAYQGGGMDIESSDLICDGTVVFDSNKAERVVGGGISAWNDSFKFYGNTTLLGNTAYQGGMGIQGSVLICETISSPSPKLFAVLFSNNVELSQVTLASNIAIPPP